MPQRGQTVRAVLKGLHTTYKGSVIYAYAWRGGPLIARVQGRDKDDARRLLEIELGKSETLARMEAARRPVPSVRFVSGVVDAFLDSPEFMRLSDASREAYRRYLLAFQREFGGWRLQLFERGETVTDLIDWRSQFKPRAADYAIQSVGRLFSWARRRGMTVAGPTRDIERLSHPDRSDIIWTDEDIARFDGPVGRAIRLAALTGLRLGDLLRLTWADVSDLSITVRTAKRKKVVVIPLLPQARALLAETPRLGPIILTNSHGRPWTTDGFKTSFQKARNAAGLSLRFHDLRGTAATRFLVAGMTPTDLSRIFGWSREHVEGMMARYVSSDVVALDMLRRMTEQGTKLQTGDKPPAGAPSSVG